MGRVKSNEKWRPVQESCFEQKWIQMIILKQGRSKLCTRAHFRTKIPLHGLVTFARVKILARHHFCTYWHFCSASVKLIFSWLVINFSCRIEKRLKKDWSKELLSMSPLTLGLWAVLSVGLMNGWLTKLMTRAKLTHAKVTPYKIDPT